MITTLTKNECYAVSGGSFSISSTTATTLHTVTDLFHGACIIATYFAVDLAWLSRSTAGQLKISSPKLACLGEAVIMYAITKLAAEGLTKLWSNNNST